MARNSSRDNRRRQFRTLLIVGEGDSEVAFLKHARGIYSSRTSNLKVTVRNGNGYGGHHTLREAIRFREHFAYDRIAILVDTDSHWNDADRKRAARARIVALESVPCIEALLLRVAGDTPAEETRRIKVQFERRFTMKAHDPRLYERHFERSVLDLASARERVIERLVSLLSESLPPT